MMFKRMTAVIAAAIFLFVLSLIAGAGEWKKMFSVVDEDPITNIMFATIFVHTSSGTEWQVTPDGAKVLSALWSSDGRQIAFSTLGGEREGGGWNTSEYIIDVDGKNLAELDVNGDVSDLSENFIAFGFVEGETPWVGIVRRDKTNKVNLAVGSDASISTNETRVVFFNGRGQDGIDVINVDGSGQRTITDRVNSKPHFVNDHQIVYGAHRGRPGVDLVTKVFLYDLETGKETELADGGAPYVVGRWVVYEYGGKYAIRPDGIERFKLPDELQSSGILWGDITPTSDPEPVEEPRAVNPRGKAAMTWGTLKVKE